MRSNTTSGPKLATTFSSLHTRNFRRYYVGNGISLVGEWAQRIGQSWLVLELTGSAVLLGLTAALQAAPTVIVGPWGGLQADRLDKRSLIVWANALSALFALVLGWLTVTDLVEVWMVLVLAASTGCAKAFEHPAKQTFVLDLVGASHLVNAVTLTSVAHNAAKIVGPAIAGLLITHVGLAFSFFANAFSYLAVIIALRRLPPAEVAPMSRVPQGPGQLRAGIRYAASDRGLAGPLSLMAVAGVLAYEWAVTLPLLARDVYGGGAQEFGMMFSAMGCGAIIGGLGIAGSLRPRTVTLTATGLAFGATMIAMSLAPTMLTVLAALVILGGAHTAFRATATSLLQLRAVPEMRGRVLSLLAVALMGTTIVGGPLAGWLSDVFGVRVAIGIGGCATIAAALAAHLFVGQREEVMNR